MSPISVTAFGLGLVIGLPQPAVFGLAVLAGGGLTAFSASWYALLADTASERRLGRTFGIINALSTLGIVVGALGRRALDARRHRRRDAGRRDRAARGRRGDARLPAAAATLAGMSFDLGPHPRPRRLRRGPARAHPHPVGQPARRRTGRGRRPRPPGGEAAAAATAPRCSSGAGIASEVIELTPGRGSCVARLPASGPTTEPPLILLGHIDVVPVDAEAWTRDPFGGDLVDGVVWGRGAVDMKDMVAMELAVMLALAAPAPSCGAT